MDSELWTEFTLYLEKVCALIFALLKQCDSLRNVEHGYLQHLEMNEFYFVVRILWTL